MPNRFRTDDEQLRNAVRNISLVHRVHNTLQPNCIRNYVSYQHLVVDSNVDAQTDDSFISDKMTVILGGDNPVTVKFQVGFENEYVYTLVPGFTQIAKFTFNGLVWVQDVPSNIELRD